jgi:PAS domain S-box-containing protein
MSWQRREPPVFDPWSADDLRELIDALPSLVAYVDVAGFNRYANAAAARWLGRPPDQVVGVHLRELLGEEGYRAAQSQLEGAARGERQEFERVLLTADGQVTRAVTTYLPRLRDGLPDGFFVLTCDLTSRVPDESEHLEATVRRAELEQRTSEAAAVSDDVLQQLYAIGLHLDALQRHPERLQYDAEPVLNSLQDTITGLRASITGLLLAGDGSSTEGVVHRLVAGWAERTCTAPAVEVDPSVTALGPAPTRHLLTALSQILATAARHGVGPFRVRVQVGEDGRARVDAEGESWPDAVRADFGRMASAARNDGGVLEIDVTHPAVTRVGWTRDDQV